MADFTPGPYRVGNRVGSGALCVMAGFEEPPHGGIVSNVRSKVLCTIHGTEPEDVANANLFGASAELLEACEAARFVCKDFQKLLLGPPSVDVRRTMREAAEAMENRLTAVISKSRGQVDPTPKGE